MTIQEAKARLLAWCNAQVGTAEGANNWNKYAEKWTEAGGWNAQNQPWCDIFVDVGFIECFGLELASRLTFQPKGSFSALCSASANFYKAAGFWRTSPEVGDQVFFNVGGGINHTGIVVAVTSGIVTTVEGNSSDAVRRNTYSIGSGYIAGYGRPCWSILDGSDVPDDPAGGSDEPEAPDHSYFPYTYQVPVALLKIGNYGPQVEHMQQLLKANGFDPGDVDGKFGDKTFAALKAFQTAVGIGVDGEWGGESFKAMWNYKNKKTEE